MSGSELLSRIMYSGDSQFSVVVFFLFETISGSKVATVCRPVRSIVFNCLS